MTPNRITLARIAMAFAAVAVFEFSGHALGADLAALALVILAIGLDAADGYLARRRKLETPLGAQLDILGDRLVENLFFTFYATAGSVSLWVPILFFTRGLATDFLRSLAAREGRSGFGANGMLESSWARALVASRASRAAYATLKCVCFCWLGFELALADLHARFLSGRAIAGIHLASHTLVLATVVFCLIRAVPVFWEGRRYLAPSAAATAARKPAYRLLRGASS